MNSEIIETLQHIAGGGILIALTAVTTKIRESKKWSAELRKMYDGLIHRDLVIDETTKESLILAKHELGAKRVWILLAKNGSVYYNGQAIFKLDMIYESVNHGLSPMQEDWQDKSTTLVQDVLVKCKEFGQTSIITSQCSNQFLKTRLSLSGIEQVFLVPFYKITDPSTMEQDARFKEPLGYVGFSFTEDTHQIYDHLYTLNNVKELMALKFSDL